MGELFKGWRRKAGCVALAMACVFAAGWVRSLGNSDEIEFKSVFGNVHSLNSRGGHVEWVQWNDRIPPEGPWTWWSSPDSEIPADRDVLILPHHIERTDWYPHGRTTTGTGIRVRYGSIVIPLTLLSAYLLLNKPRVANPQKTIEPDRA